MRFIKTIYGTLSILLLFALISLVNITGETWIMPTGIIVYVILTIVLIFLKGDSIMAKKKPKGKNEEKKPKEEKKAKKVVGGRRSEPANEEGNAPDVQVGNKSILPINEGAESPFTMGDEADEEALVDDDGEDTEEEPDEKSDKGRGEGKLSKIASEIKELKRQIEKKKEALEEKKEELLKVAGEL